LQRSDVLIHPSYEDGFGYAPVEALATGVPAIVTEDTGMKEYVVPGQNGFIVPTGSVDAVVTALEHLLRYPLVSPTSLFYEPDGAVPA
jgi:glycosyltransferase involved in cell wall biosynthesis